MFEVTDRVTAGDRVGYYRRRRGISQRVLAELVGRTEDWLSRVENNKIELDRVSIIRRLADALRVRVGDLLDGAALDADSHRGEQRLVADLSEVIMDYRQLAPFLVEQQEIGTEPNLDTIRQGLGGVFDAYQSSRYKFVIARTPSVLSDALRAASLIASSLSSR